MKKIFMSTVIIIALLSFIGCSRKTPTDTPAEPVTSNNTANTAQQSEASAEETEAIDENRDPRFDWLIDTSPVTISLFEDWPAGVDDPNLLGLQKLRDATGVTLERIYPTVWDGQQLILMLASDSLPDVVVMEYGAEWRSSFILQARESNMIWAFDDLIEMYAPHFKELVAPEYFQLFQEDDGKTYQYVNAINTAVFHKKREEYGVVSGAAAVLVRKDFYEGAGSPDMATPDGFISGLKAMSELYPGLTPLMTPWDTWRHPFGNFAEQFAVPPFHIPGDGSVQHRYRSPQALEATLFVNRLTREGLLPREAIIEGTDVQAMVFNGQLLSYLWNTMEEGKIPDDNPDTYYTFLPPFASWKGFDTASTGGWKSILISKKTPHPDRVIRMLEFMASEEGHRVLYWGNEGESPANGGAWSGDFVNGPHYYYDEQGKPTYYVEFWSEKVADWSGHELRTGLMQIYYGQDAFFTEVVRWIGSDPVAAKVREHFGGKREYVPWMSINVPADTPESEIDSRLRIIMENYLASILFAPSEAESISQYERMLQEMDDAGLPLLEEFYTRVYHELYGMFN